MIKTHSMLIEELSDYAAPANKLARMVRDGAVFPIVRGLYETDPATSPHLLAASIYGPSYISFEFALSFHGLIPENALVVTSATFEKKRKKRYNTPFGIFTYQDVPAAAFPLGIEVRKDGDYYYRIASPEKALCDKLYALHPVSSLLGTKALLFDDLRIDELAFAKLDEKAIYSFEEAYRCTNVKMLCSLLRKERG